MEDQLILCRYLSKKKLILSRTAFRIISIILSPSLISMIIKSLIHHDCQTFGSRYPFDLDTIDSQHYIKLDKIYYFFSFSLSTPTFCTKKRKRKKNEFECKPFILYDGWKNIKKPRQLIFLHHTHTYQRYAIDTNP